MMYHWISQLIFVEIGDSRQRTQFLRREAAEFGEVQHVGTEYEVESRVFPYLFSKVAAEWRIRHRHFVAGRVRIVQS